jgi:MFS transporter, DHA1 family, multidrug resistance protein
MNHWKQSFYFIWFAEFMAIAGFATTTPIIPLYLRELGITETGALNFWNGISQSASSLALAIFAPIWGSVADGYGRKPMLVRAMFGGAILIALMALTTAPWQVLVLRALQGCVTGTVAAATVLVASMVPREETGYRLGLLQMAIFLGSSIGPLFGGVVADAAGPRVNFLATGAILALSGLLVLRFVHEDFVPTPKSGSLLHRMIPDFSPMAHNPALIALMFVTFTDQFASAVAVPILPLIVMNLSGTDKGVGTMSGLIIGAGALAAALSAGAVGKVSRRIGYGRTLLTCVGGAMVFYVLQGFATTPMRLLWLRVGACIFIGGTMPSVNALIAQLCDPRKQGSTYGLSSSASSVGAALGPAVGALVATAAGYSSVFFVTAAIILMNGITVIRSASHGISFEAGPAVEDAASGPKRR